MTAPGTRWSETPRGQASLPALGVALLILSSVTVLSLGVASGTFDAASRDPTDRRTASNVAEALVDSAGPLAIRANVLDAERLRAFDEEALADRFPSLEGIDLRVRVDDQLIVSTGRSDDGVTIRRLVLVSERDLRHLEPTFGSSRAVVLPRRTDRVRLTISPSPNTTVRTVTANERVVLHEPNGLAGTYGVRLSSRETVTLAFEGNGSLSRGSVQLAFPVEYTRKAQLVVTADG